MITTTSPSYIVMSSMDYARDFAKRNGSTNMKLLTKLDELKDQLMKMENCESYLMRLMVLKRSNENCHRHKPY